MKSIYLFLACALSLVLCEPGVAQDVSPERTLALAAQIYASKDVQRLVSSAKAMQRLDTGNDDKSLTAQVNRSEHPHPYGREDPNTCAIEMRAVYGWYADAALVVTVKAFIPSAKLANGNLTRKDVKVQSFSAAIPERSGLE